MGDYPHLFSKGKIGNLTLRNRSVMTAMGVGLGQEDGCVTEEEAVFLTRRAKGGAGLIITGIMRVEETCGKSVARQLSASDGRHIPGLKKLAEAVHAEGAAIFGQLQHPGNTAPPKLNDRVLSPSGISAASGVPAEILTVNEIRDLVSRFGEAALRLKKAGFDGIEVHAAHFYLIHQFLSPTYNHRTDEYGGNSEKRFRFLKEIVEEIRKSCGKDFPLIVRISLEEYIGETGYHPDYGITICRRLEALGIDALNITASGSASPRGQSIEYLTYGQGWRRFLVRAVKRCVHIPVIGVCVIRDPAFAEEILASGDADFIGSGRNHLADPDWENKAASGREAEIRRCISCLRCIENLKCGHPAYCSVNPICGKEAANKPPAEDGGGRLVIVLGAGPAGMETALTAARRGFRVSLYEKEKQAGGQVYLAAQVPGKGRLNWLLEDLKRDCLEAGVNMYYGISPTADSLLSQQPYAVIDATGGIPLIPESIPGTKNSFVCTPADILSGKVRPENESILIVGSGLTGLETAEYLMQIAGNAVMIMEMAERIAPEAYIAARVDALTRLQVDNVILMPGRELLRIGEDRVFFREAASGEERELPVDRVVLSMGVRSAQPYGDELLSVGVEVCRIGDAEKPARIMEAVTAGYEAACRL